MRDEGVPPQHDGSEHRAVGKAVANGEEPSSDAGTHDLIWKPQVEEDEEVGEVAEVKQEVVVTALFVGIPSVCDQDDCFLEKNRINVIIVEYIVSVLIVSVLTVSVLIV